MKTLEYAILIATKTHSSQKDKAGKPYILHPLRVMFKMDTEEEMIAAVLHDTVEDAGYYTLEDIREWFSKTISNAIDSLTRRTEESYNQYIDRVRLNPLATIVKIADLFDNKDLTRFDPDLITDKDRKRADKYDKALGRIINIEK